MIIAVQIRIIFCGYWAGSYQNFPLFLIAILVFFLEDFVVIFKSLVLPLAERMYHWWLFSFIIFKTQTSIRNFFFHWKFQCSKHNHVTLSRRKYYGFIVVIHEKKSLLIFEKCWRFESWWNRYRLKGGLFLVFRENRKWTSE